MPFVIVIVGVIIAIAAFNNSFASLAKELETDLPGYFVWGAAIAAILGLGFIPGFKTPSRYLLALVAVVVFFANWQSVVNGFKSFASSGGAASGSPPAAPTASYSAANAPAAAAAASSTGGTAPTTTAAAAATTLTAAQTLAANPLNPNAYVGLVAGFGGLA
jgi:hypothetical protein